jgi:Xaa-Pro dipeptidase
VMPKAVVPDLPPFTEAEYRARLDRARALMDAEGVGTMLLTTEPNFRWFSGYTSQSWVSPTRPLFLLISLDRDPVVIIPDGSLVAMAQTSWVRDLRTWPAPCPADDGVSLLADAIRTLSGAGGKFVAELGPETQLRMPLADFFRLRELIAPVTVHDGTPIMRRLRMTKSPAELARIRLAGKIVSEVFAGVGAHAASGLSERDICLWFKLEALRHGVDRIAYLIAASGQGGYRTINTDPSDRVLSPGDVLIIDAGCTIDGYFCDFDRNWSFGPPAPAVRDAYARVHAATDAGFAAVRPGVRACDVWHAMAASLGEDAVRAAGVGRMGHGLGLNLTEPPSIHPDDETELRPGMVITLEPGMAYVLGNGSRGVMVDEENVVVTEHGAEMLTRRAPAELPVIA